jgi:trans-aconitate 2-methyltransferase
MMSDWDAATYDRVAEPQEEWGLEVLERLELSGDETVLDAGCGSGRMTRHLVDRLPEGQVIGVDSSPSMIEKARENLGERADLRVGSLLDLDLGQEVDAIFSNATFHWIHEHDRLFARLFAVLRPGGVMEAQCGGQGNVAEVENALLALEGDERFASYLRTTPQPWYFASVGDTQGRLARAGFEATRCWIETKDVRPATTEAWPFLSSCVVNQHLDRLPDDLREPFLEALVDSMPQPLTLRYVRLNISARRHR